MSTSGHLLPSMRMNFKLCHKGCRLKLCRACLGLWILSRGRAVSYCLHLKICEDLTRICSKLLSFAKLPHHWAWSWTLAVLVCCRICWWCLWLSWSSWWANWMMIAAGCCRGLSQVLAKDEVSQNTHQVIESVVSLCSLESRPDVLFAWLFTAVCERLSVYGFGISGMEGTSEHGSRFDSLKVFSGFAKICSWSVDWEMKGKGNSGGFLSGWMPLGPTWGVNSCSSCILSCSPSWRWETMPFCHLECCLVKITLDVTMHAHFYFLIPCRLVLEKQHRKSILQCFSFGYFEFVRLAMICWLGCRCRSCFFVSCCLPYLLLSLLLCFCCPQMKWCLGLSWRSMGVSLERSHSRLHWWGHQIGGRGC